MLALRHRWTFVQVGDFLNSSEAHHGAILQSVCVTFILILQSLSLEPGY